MTEIRPPAPFRYPHTSRAVEEQPESALAFREERDRAVEDALSVVGQIVYEEYENQDTFFYTLSDVHVSTKVSHVLWLVWVTYGSNYDNSRSGNVQLNLTGGVGNTLSAATSAIVTFDAKLGKDTVGPVVTSSSVSFAALSPDGPGITGSRLACLWAVRLR